MSKKVKLIYKIMLSRGWNYCYFKDNTEEGYYREQFVEGWYDRTYYNNNRAPHAEKVLGLDEF